MNLENVNLNEIKQKITKSDFFDELIERAPYILKSLLAGEYLEIKEDGITTIYVIDNHGTLCLIGDKDGEPYLLGLHADFKDLLDLCLKASNEEVHRHLMNLNLQGNIEKGKLNEIKRTLSSERMKMEWVREQEYKKLENLYTL